MTKYDSRKSRSFKGYTAFLSGNSDPANRGDLHEGFDFGYEDLDPAQKLSRADSAMSGANVWPTQVPEFRDAVLKY